LIKNLGSIQQKNQDIVLNNVLPHISGLYAAAMEQQEPI